MTDVVTATRPADGCESRQAQDYVLDIVIPVYNEERGLAGLRPPAARNTLASEVPYRSRITMADNASTDETLAVAHRLADELPDVAVIHLDAKGRGGALQTAWSTSDADVVAYMDVDLSTDLSALMPLVAPLISGHSDLRSARGWRRHRGSSRSRSANSSPAVTTCCCAAHSAPDSPMPSAASRRCAPTWPANCCRWWPTPAGSSTPSCW